MRVLVVALLCFALTAAAQDTTEGTVTIIDDDDIVIDPGNSVAATFTAQSIFSGLCSTDKPYGWNFLDYDGDGDLDILVQDHDVATAADSCIYEYTGGSYVYDATASNSIRDPNCPTSAGCGQFSNATGDYNNDGFEDFFVYNNEGTVPLWFASNGTTFSKVIPAPSLTRRIWVDIADWDGDNDLDWVDDCRAIRQMSDGAIVVAAAYGDCASLAGDVQNAPMFIDLDGDTWPDMWVPAASTNGLGGFTWRNVNGVPTAQTHDTDLDLCSGATSAVPIDYDLDGDADIVCEKEVNETEDIVLLRNDGNFQFTPITGIGFGAVNWNSASLNIVAYGGIYTADMNNDGWMDVWVSTGVASNDDITIFRNNGSGAFIHDNEATIFGSNLAICSDYACKNPVDIGDYDGDGKLDVVGRYIGTAKTPVAATLWRNTTATGNNWLKVNVRDYNNRDCIGCRVELMNGATRVGSQWVMSNGKHAINASRNLHFGMSDLTSVTVNVYWPNGRGFTTIPAVANNGTLDVSRTGATATVQVEWDPVSQNTDGTAANITGYRVYYQIDGGNESTVDTGGATVSIPSLPAGWYTFQVDATNGTNRSERSSPVRAYVAPVTVTFN